MHKTSKYKKIIQNHNEGVTLVELLVALAVGMIIISALTLLIQQSMKGYRIQTTTSQLQNEANITMTQISDDIMQATQIQIVNETAAEQNTVQFVTSSNNVYFFDPSSQRLYYASNTNATEVEKGLVCDHVTGFYVRIDEGSLVGYTDMPGKIEKLQDTVRIQVTLQLETGGIKREVTKTIGMRNKIKDITVGLAGQTDKGVVDQYVNSLSGFVTTND